MCIYIFKENRWNFNYLKKNVDLKSGEKKKEKAIKESKVL